MRLNPKSLRKRLLLYLFIAAVIVFVLTELIFLEKNRRSLVKMLDKTAEACVLHLAALPPGGPDGIRGTDSFDDIMRDFGGHHTRVYFLILRVRDGRELERSKSLKDINFSPPFRLREVPREEAFFWNARIKGKGVRFVALRQAPKMEAETEEAERVISDEETSEISSKGASPLGGIENECVYIVGLSERYIRKRLQDTFEVTAPILGIGLVLMLLLGWTVIHRGLEPLRHLEQEVNRISSSNMTPVTIPEDKELASIAETLNTTISNLKRAFERERRFTSNVAHELRTPISEVRSLAEVALEFENDLHGCNRKNYEDILASAKEMQDTVVNLLTLARCQSDQLKPRRDTVALEPLIDTIWNEHKDRAFAKGIDIRRDVQSDICVATDRDLLSIILHNLFANAVSYVPERGKIEWEAKTRGDEFSFSLSNTVENLSESDLAHLFEPFWRKDEAHTAGDGHSGLGLSLVQSLAGVLDLDVSARLTAPTVLTIALSGKAEDGP